jgi:hypothetical protein
MQPLYIEYNIVTPTMQGDSGRKYAGKIFCPCLWNILDGRGIIWIDKRIAITSEF